MELQIINLFFHMTGDRDYIAEDATLGWFKVGTTKYSVFGRNLDTGERAFEVWWHSEFEKNFDQWKT